MLKVYPTYLIFLWESTLYLPKCQVIFQPILAENEKSPELYHLVLWYAQEYTSSYGSFGCISSFYFHLEFLVFILGLDSVTQEFDSLFSLTYTGFFDRNIKIK